MEKYDSKKDTMAHKTRVYELLKGFSDRLLSNAVEHDNSKLKDPEKAIFDVMTPKLKGLTYGSDEYAASLKELGVALTHHYENNRHHPEHFENGLDDMDLFDVLEMLFDWKAATERHDNGDIYKSLEHNEKRFDINPQLIKIFKNTCDNLGYNKPKENVNNK